MKSGIRLLLTVCLLFSLKANSSKVVSINDDDWSNPSSWAGNEVPTKPDTIIIRHYITFSKNLTISAPTVLIIESGATLCGDFFLDVICGAKLINHGHLYIHSGVITDGDNFGTFYSKLMISVVSCTKPGFGKGFLNAVPGSVEVWPPVLCKTKDTDWTKETGIIEAQPIIGLSISPNPINSGLLKVEGNNINEVRLYNVCGRLIFENKGNNSVLIDMQDYPAGLYVLRLTWESQTVVKKVLKQ